MNLHLNFPLEHKSEKDFLLSNKTWKPNKTSLTSMKNKSLHILLNQMNASEEVEKYIISEYEIRYTTNHQKETKFKKRDGEPLFVSYIWAWILYPLLYLLLMIRKLTIPLQNLLEKYFYLWFLLPYPISFIQISCLGKKN